MKKILVPTDFSKNAYAALFYVTKLFSDEALQITILHSFGEEVGKLTSRVDIGRSDNIIEKLYRQSNEDGEQLVHKIKLDSSKVAHNFEVISTPATLSKTVNKLVSTEGIDLVVMGSKGRTGAEDVLVGSTTEKITKSLEGCPLLIVPREVDFVIPSNIAFATDYNDFYQLSKLRPIVRLVRQYNSTLHLVHVGSKSELDTNQQQNLEKYQNDLTEYNTQFHFISKGESISKTLHTFIDNNTMDLLALVYHKHAFLKQLFREPVVSRVGKHTHIPTLVIPIKK
ncbi:MULTISPECIES: universal stress protein [Aequorivita]|uniref:Universal stress protein n=1 Tax=Aequorivita iocasae TaxID=2803865 RepID=A0ABX7DQC3_9FLAO|nr:MULTISPECIES: universal stress protein [Aequorivita]QQX75796.1 universal stress protein [Aequorivita iocasae]UCA55256.1 universal stress protein [Aequorivita sp. F7]